MSRRTLVILVFLAFVVESLVFFYFYHRLDDQVGQLQHETLDLHTQVSQLRIWKLRQEADVAQRGMGGPPPSAGAPQERVAAKPPASLSLTRFLAQLVVVDHAPGLAISPQQASSIRAAVRGVEEEKKTDQSAEELDTEWRALERLLTPQQAAWIAEHKDLVDSKTDELAGAAHDDGTSVRDLLFDFLRKGR